MTDGQRLRAAVRRVREEQKHRRVDIAIDLITLLLLAIIVLVINIELLAP